MVLPVDYENDDFRFFKTLNEDVQVKPVYEKGNHWDIQMKNGDYVNVTGEDSLRNAICIAIMTRFGEMTDNPLYNDFGCRLHELIKANKSRMVYYKVQLFTEEVLNKMRRIREVNWVEVTESDNHAYKIDFNVTSTSDEIVEGSVNV